MVKANYEVLQSFFLSQEQKYGLEEFAFKSNTL